MRGKYQGRWLKLLLAVLMLLIFALVILIFFTPLIIKADVNRDLLVYTISGVNGQRSLMMYDLNRGLSAPILAHRAVNDFSLSVDGRVAFSSSPGSIGDVYILDTSLLDSQPINITQSPATDDRPLGWSRDGHYLAFRSQQGANIRLYVWDGETAVDITPDIDGVIIVYAVDWSFDRRLAFAMAYRSTSQPEINKSAIYLWDGTTSTNLSQTSTDEAVSPVWNRDGQLAFISNSDSIFDIFVWDGVSFANGAPDAQTFAHLSPGLANDFAVPTWTNDGLLSFEGRSPQDTHVQVYTWDGQSLTNVSQNPTFDNDGTSWSADGRWAFVTFFSTQPMLYVRDADNQPLLTIDGQYPPAWSSNGNLIFCRFDGSAWELSLWDGQNIIPIARGGDIFAQWESGAKIVCSGA